LYLNKQITEWGAKEEMTMPKNNLLRPGERAKVSGQYEIVRNGHRTGVERTATRNEPLPPTPKSGDKFLLVDKTKH